MKQALLRVQNMDFMVYPSHRSFPLIYLLVGFPHFPMFILFIIYLHINFDIGLVNYIDDGYLDLGSETSGLLL